MNGQPEHPGDINKEGAREYRTCDLIIHWYPKMCIHATTCWKTLSTVFRPEERPWVDPSAASPREIIRTIDLCPAGALKYELPVGSRVDPALAMGPGWADTQAASSGPAQIRLTGKGPIIVQGALKIVDESSDRQTEIKSPCVLCGCGMSKRSPYCDGTHLKGKKP